MSFVGHAAAPTSETVGGRTYWFWTVTGTAVGPTDDFVIEDLPRVFTITLFEAAASGGASTVNPQLSLADEWSGATVNHIASNDKAEQMVRNDCFLRVTAPGAALYCRPKPNATGNVTIRITLMEGH